MCFYCNGDSRNITSSFLPLNEESVDISYAQLDYSTSAQNMDVALHLGVFCVSYLYPQEKRKAKISD